MTQLARVIRRQLQLRLETESASPHPVGQVQAELIEALADLLREALGTETTPTSPEGEVNDEFENHA
jgi:hypothetical protein